MMRLSASILSLAMLAMPGKTADGLVTSAEYATDACDIVNGLGSTLNVATPATPNIYDQAREQWASALGSTEASDYMLHPEAVVFFQDDDDVLSVIDFAN
jgi:hypothetical protein